MARLSKIEEENVKLSSENKKLSRDNSDLRKEMDELNVNMKDEFDHFTQEIKSLSKTVQKDRFKINKKLDNIFCHFEKYFIFLNFKPNTAK